MDESTPNPEEKPEEAGGRRASGNPGDQSSRGMESIGGAVEFLSLGLAIAVSLVAGALLGYLLDRWLGTVPLFTLVGLALGATAAVLMTVSRVRQYL